MVHLGYARVNTKTQFALSSIGFSLCLCVDCGSSTVAFVLPSSNSARILIPVLLLRPQIFINLRFPLCARIAVLFRHVAHFGVQRCAVTLHLDARAFPSSGNCTVITVGSVSGRTCAHRTRPIFKLNTVFTQAELASRCLTVNTIPCLSTAGIGWRNSGFQPCPQAFFNRTHQ